MRSALDSLSPEAVDRLWAAQHDLDGLALFSDCTKSPFGHTIMRVRYGDAVELRYLRTPQLTEAVEVIGNLAAKASKSLYRDLGGRPSDGALWIWVVNMQNLWVKVLGRKFTYDTHCGEGSTDAFRFCQMLMRPLDPRVTGTQLGSVMRKAIRLSRKCKPVPKSQPAR